MADSSNPIELQEKLKEVLADEAFAKEIFQMEKPEDVQIALEEKGVELSLDEIKQIGEFLQKVQSGEISQEQLQRMADGELTEDELEEVAGGSLVFAIVMSVVALGAGAGLITLMFCRW